MLPRSQPLSSTEWWHSQKLREGVKPLLIWQCRVTTESMNQQDWEILPQFTSDNVNPPSRLKSGDRQICVPQPPWKSLTNSMYQDEQMDQQKDKSMSLEDSNYMQYHNEQTDRQTRLRNPCHGDILTYRLHSSEQIDRQTDRQIHVKGIFLLIACIPVNR